MAGVDLSLIAKISRGLIGLDVGSYSVKDQTIHAQKPGFDNAPIELVGFCRSWTPAPAVQL